MKSQQISLKSKEKLKKDISKLDYNEHCEIYNIIRKDTDKISENNNGVFINLSKINSEVLNKINDLINFYKKNNEYLEEDKRRIQLLNK